MACMQVYTVKNKYFRLKEKIHSPGPDGELSEALARQTCGSKPGVGGIFFPSLAFFCFMFFVLRSLLISKRSKETIHTIF